MEIQGTVVVDYFWHVGGKVAVWGFSKDGTNSDLRTVVNDTTGIYYTFAR